MHDAAARRAAATCSATAVYMWLVDLDELHGLDRACWAFGHDRRGSPRSAPATTWATRRATIKQNV